MLEEGSHQFLHLSTTNWTFSLSNAFTEFRSKAVYFNFYSVIIRENVHNFRAFFSISLWQPYSRNIAVNMAALSATGAPRVTRCCKYCVVIFLKYAYCCISCFIQFCCEAPTPQELKMLVHKNIQDLCIFCLVIILFWNIACQWLLLLLYANSFLPIMNIMQLSIQVTLYFY